LLEPAQGDVLSVEAPPRYLRATLLTSAAIATLPAGLLALAIVDLMTRGVRNTNDSGAAQGFLMFLAAGAFAVAFSLLAFPLAARRLHRVGKYPLGFFRLVWVWLACAVGVLSAALAVAERSLLTFGFAALFLFLFATLLCMPFAKLWIKLAQ
jgi:hypothetical protein